MSTGKARDSAIGLIKGGLIVSCQAIKGEPFDDPHYLALMARAAALGGAAGIRANGPDSIRAIRQVVSLPILAINKIRYPDSEVYITPTFKSAVAVSKAGGDIIAVDGTGRPRPGAESLKCLIHRIRTELGRSVMADVSTVSEGVEAAEAGADMIATTLAGYTPYSRQQSKPDFELLAELIESVEVPVILEGRVSDPAAVAMAFSLGAHAVVIGTAITRPNEITRRFVDAIPARNTQP